MDKLSSKVDDVFARAKRGGEQRRGRPLGLVGSHFGHG